MATRSIINVNNNLLRAKSKTIIKFDDSLIELLDDMKETLKQQDGCGLAAVQVGIIRRVFIIDINELYMEFVNPVIVKQSGTVIEYEGCLSVPNTNGKVPRPNKVTVRAQNRFGDRFELTVEGYTARVICHEYDHLEGILFTDRMIAK